MSGNSKIGIEEREMKTKSVTLDADPKTIFSALTDHKSYELYMIQLEGGSGADTVSFTKTGNSSETIIDGVNIGDATESDTVPRRGANLKEPFDTLHTGEGIEASGAANDPVATVYYREKVN